MRNPAEMSLEKDEHSSTRPSRSKLLAVRGRRSPKYSSPLMSFSMSGTWCRASSQTLLSDRRFSPDHQRTRPPVSMDDLEQYLYVYRDSRWKALLAAAGIGTGANQDINAFFSKFSKRPSNSTSRHEAVKNVLGLFNRFSEECLSPERAKRRSTDELPYPTHWSLSGILGLAGRWRSRSTDGFSAGATEGNSVVGRLRELGRSLSSCHY